MSYFCYLESADGSRPHFEALAVPSPQEALRMASAILAKHDSAVRAEVRGENDDLVGEVRRRA
jgi:hypothetical protein